MRQIVYRFGKGWSQELAAAFSCLHTRFQAAPGAADVGMQSLPGFCFSEQGGKTFFSPPSSGKQEINSYKGSPTYRQDRKKVEFGNIDICSSNAEQ